MAAIKAEQIDHLFKNVAELWRWQNVTEADTCAALALPHKADKTIQTLGTLNGGSVTLKGSLKPGSATADQETITDGDGVAIVMTTKKPRLLRESAFELVPVLAGTGMLVDIYLIAI